MYTEEGTKLLIFHVSKRATEDYMSDIRKIKRLDIMYRKQKSKTILGQCRAILLDMMFCEDWMTDRIVDFCKKMAGYGECEFLIEEAKNEFKV